LITVATDSSTDPAGKENRLPTQRLSRSRLNDADRRRMQENLREVDFPIAMRGYDRAAVDRYVKEVNRVIAELELSSSPESAVRHALDEVSEETSGLLQRAYETSEEITARSRAKADDRIQQAEREAEAMREAAGRDAREVRETAQREAEELRASAKQESEELRASAKQQSEELRASVNQQTQQLRAATEARVEELERNAEAVWRERRRLIEDMRSVAKEQLEIAEAAMARFPQTSAGAGAKQPATEGPEQS
jgi:DivIVA domain-containing protein